MNRYNAYLLIFLISSINTFGQSLSINYDLNPKVYNISEPLNLWLDFLKTKDDLKGSKYWNSEEVEKYGDTSYFLIEKALDFGTDNYLHLLSYSDIKVLSIRKIQEYYKITSLMEFPRKDTISNIQYIFSVYATKDKNEKLKLYNPLEINAKLFLSSTKIEFINFHYPKTHKFNLELAKKQNEFLKDFSKSFNVPLDTIDYYFASTEEELQKIKGFDFYIGGNGEQIPSGKADPENRIVYSTGLEEYYPHEFIHVLLNPHYPNMHNWISEGIATYFSMSRGKSLNWHLEKLNLHLIQHPEIDLNNMLELRNLDQYTDYRYALGGFIIKKAFEKGGYELIKDLMKAGKSDEDFYKAIKEYLNIDRNDLNKVTRDELKTTYNHN